MADKINKKGVYIIQFGDSQSMKVGRTTNLEKRKQQLQTANSDELKVVRFYETEHHVYLEGCLHRFLKDKHKRLEFYTDININEVDKFVDLFNNVIEFKPNFDNYDEKELRLFFIKLLGGEQDDTFDENGKCIDYSDDEHLTLKYHVECDEDYENAIEIKNRLKWFNVYDNIEDVDFIGWKGNMFIQIKMKHYRIPTSYWYFSEKAVINHADVFGVTCGNTYIIPLQGFSLGNKKHIFSEKYNVVLKPDYHVFVNCDGNGTISILSMLMIINNLFYHTKYKHIIHTDDDVKKMTYISKLKYVELDDYERFLVNKYYDYEKDEIIKTPTFNTTDEIETFLNETPYGMDFIQRFDNNFGIT